MYGIWGHYLILNRALNRVSASLLNLFSNIVHMRPLLSLKDAEKVIHAFITARWTIVTPCSVADPLKPLIVKIQLPVFWHLTKQSAHIAPYYVSYAFTF